MFANYQYVEHDSVDFHRAHLWRHPQMKEIAFHRGRLSQACIKVNERSTPFLRLLSCLSAFLIRWLLKINYIYMEQVHKISQWMSLPYKSSRSCHSSKPPESLFTLPMGTYSKTSSGLVSVSSHSTNLRFISSLSKLLACSFIPRIPRSVIKAFTGLPIPISLTNRWTTSYSLKSLLAAL